MPENKSANAGSKVLKRLSQPGRRPLETQPIVPLGEGLSLSFSVMPEFDLGTLLSHWRADSLCGGGFLSFLCT